MLGLEVHVELGTVSKMFCGCDTTFGAPPNSQVCPTCLGLPGSLPVLNAVAVESIVRVGLALSCDIASWCRFARKNYFYPDMPKNFQTSQYDEPICTDGYLDVEVDTDDGPAGSKRTFRVEIERVHMEEDTGKSLHVGGATGRIHGADYSLVDYNRAGIPLIEIVTKPVEGTGALAPRVARAYVTALRELMRTLGVSDVRMEQGSLRCDVNLSLRRSPSDPLGTRSETKNVNSLRSVERAVRHEIAPAGGPADRGRPGGAGDPALARGHRHHDVRPVQGAGRGLPLLPGAGPGAGRARPGLGRGAAGRPARVAGRAPGRAAGRLGRHRPGDDRAGQRRRRRPGREHGRRRRAAGRGPQVVAGRAGPARQRALGATSPSCRSPPPRWPRWSPWSSPAR